MSKSYRSPHVASAWAWAELHLRVVQVTTRKKRFNRSAVYMTTRQLTARCREWCTSNRLPQPIEREMVHALRALDIPCDIVRRKRWWKVRIVMPDQIDEMVASDHLQRVLRAEPVMSTADFARVVGVSPGTLRTWRHRRCGPREHRISPQKIVIRVTDAIAWARARGMHVAVFDLCDWARESGAVRPIIETRRIFVADKPAGARYVEALKLEV